ncbi:histidine phosphatase family protein, partial [Streptococcus thermophilus]
LATGQTDYQRVKGLKEMHFGIFEDQSEYLHPKTSVAGHFGYHYVQFGGESQDQFVERVVASAKEIVERHPEQ